MLNKILALNSYPGLKIDHSYQSANFNERPAKTNINTLVLHYTAGNFKTSLAILTDSKRANRVSSHYLLSEEGIIFSLVNEDKRAWHAGLGDWGEEHNLNNVSIGIEIVNQGDRPFKEAQYASLIPLCTGIAKKYNIPPRNIIGHSDLTPTRKQDPGRFFEWRRLHEAGLGVLPLLEEVKDGPTVIAKKGDSNDNVASIQNNLNQFGYKLTVDSIFGPTTEKTVIAFKTHYCSGLDSKLEVWDNLAEASLRSVLSQLSGT